MHERRIIALPPKVISEFVWSDTDETIHGTEWREILTPDETARRETFKSNRRRQTFTMGRVAARRLLGRTLDIPPSQVPLVISESGAIDVDGFDGFLSISHTDDAAVAVVSEMPVGVDMEPIKARVDDLYTYVLAECEYPLLEKSGLDRNSATLVCWVVKEAVLKGLRTGLRRSPSDLKLSINFESGVGSVFVADGSPWTSRHYEIAGNYLAIAYPE